MELRYGLNVPVDSTERTSGHRRGQQAVALHPVLYLVMEGGRPQAGGVRLALHDADDVVLGRGDERAIERDATKRAVRLRVPDRRMSVAHARIVLAGGRAVLEDLGSTNGTLVDGERVERAELASGAVIEAGQSFFLYAEATEDPSWRTTDLDAERTPAREAGLATLDPILAARLARVERVAQSGVAVMLTGETGTGKEVLARAVHALSGRPGPFVALNCGAIPQTLVESQLFGFVKGAFSGATRDEPGLVRAAHLGSLFLDEIGDLPAASQAALLRVLQEGEVLAVGATRPTKVDVRVVCATHQPLEDLMRRGAFRRDLYARLAGFTFELPPLRERTPDLGLLVAALLRSPKVKDGESLRFRPEAVRALLEHRWPLNVRELLQTLSTSSVLAEERVVRVEDLPASVTEAAPSSADASSAGEEDNAIRRELLLRLAETNGNVSEVARAMGKARQQVQRWVRRFGIDPEAFRKQG
jgi:transcriptional regulator with GAF, ATPase, and Fis domain